MGNVQRIRDDCLRCCCGPSWVLRRSIELLQTVDFPEYSRAQLGHLSKIVVPIPVDVLHQCQITGLYQILYSQVHNVLRKHDNLRKGKASVLILSSVNCGDLPLELSRSKLWVPKLKSFSWSRGGELDLTEARAGAGAIGGNEIATGLWTAGVAIVLDFWGERASPRFFTFGGMSTSEFESIALPPIKERLISSLTTGRTGGNTRLVISSSKLIIQYWSNHNQDRNCQFPLVNFFTLFTLHLFLNSDGRQFEGVGIT
ncbi:hypothetical protein Acr_00g0005380 [Actinidia rufa]|uniref:Uncharacterized protein n=1 Tax=Actinidia rufa TaxID=165716 RepID=A0A7J0D7R8_9ERIC|nr:hypothetical protein Acr_00g0005380 [Actinidia rufa]